jgi:CheY-like chemotaxis protein
LDVALKTLLGELPPGDYVELSVTDNGCGITDENMPRLFEPFFTTKGKGKGVGLGLSTAYGVVKSCNGGIVVKSKINAGTSFELIFPQVSGNINESEDSATAVKNAMPKATSNDEIVLLVDDEETILYTTKRMLESLGYQVLSTRSALEAVELAKQYENKLSLLLTDVIMPEMNGLEMVQKILVHLPNLPYLYMSGYTANLLSEHGVSNQAIDMVHKPFTRADLAKKVRDCLDKSLELRVAEKVS